MNSVLFALLLLGENARAADFVKGFRAGNLHFPLYVLLPLAIVGLAVATACYVAQRFTASRERGRFYSSRRLFYDLCRLHRLDASSIRCLEQLARREKFAHAAEVFVRPDLFQVDLNDRRRNAALMQRLREKLFGG